MINRFRAAAALFLLAVAGSCGDATLSGDEGVMSFDYSGQYNGSFDVRGKHPDHTYAEGVRDGIGMENAAYGARYRDGLITQLYIQLLPPTGLRVGRYTFGDVGEFEAAGSFAVREPRSFPVPFVFTSGTVEVTSVTETRMRGRFEGTVRRGESTVQIQRGSFEFLSGSISPFRGGPACTAGDRRREGSGRPCRGFLAPSRHADRPW